MKTSKFVLPLAAAALAIGVGAASAQMQSSAKGQSPAQPTMSASDMNRMTRGTAYQVPLNQVTDAKSTLASASVVDKDGNSVGSVKDIKTDSSGAATVIKVDVGGFLGVGSKVVSLSPSRLTYERDRNILITNMTKDEIKALPASTA